MNLRLSLLVAALVLLFAPLTQAQTQTQCNATIIDQAGVIHNPQVIGSAARTLINQGADVKVVIVDSIANYGSSLTDVERRFELNCPSWTTNGQRKANLFVVMVAPNDRAKNMFLGSYYNGAFDITSTYSQLSNTYFKNRQWELGLAAVLTGTTGQATSFHAAQQRGPGAAGQPRTYTASGAQNATPVQTQQTDNSGTSGLLIFFLVLLTLSIFGLVLYFVLRKKTEETETTTPTTTDYDTTPVPDRTSSYPAPSPYRYAAAAPSHTTVINNNSGSGDGFVSGLVVGEMLNRPNNPTVVYEQPQTTYVEPAPSYTPPAPSAPDSTWEEPTQSAPDTSFSEPESTPSYDPPSSDFGGSSDSGFGGSSGGDSGF